MKLKVSGRLKVGDAVSAEIDNDIRDSIMRNHSVTHLMHKALRDVLGTHVEQKGSLQNAELTRFDISHPQGISAEEIAEVERRVNAAIIANVPVKVETMSIEDAQKSGAVMLFGEKYGDKSLWEGSLYVFDKRMHMEFTPDTVTIGQCERCSAPSNKFENCSNESCRELVLLCPECAIDDAKRRCVPECAADRQSAHAGIS